MAVTSSPNGQMLSLFEGNYIQAIDMIVNMSDKMLKFGPQVRDRDVFSEEIQSILQEHD